jgi:hypothetical protein
MTNTFTDGNFGMFAYTVNGTSQAKPITRQIFRAPCANRHASADRNALIAGVLCTERHPCGGIFLLGCLDDGLWPTFVVREWRRSPQVPRRADYVNA